MSQKISALTAASAALGADEMEVNEAGTSKKVTITQIAAFLAALTQTLTNKTLTTPVVNQPNIVGTTTNDSAAAGSVGELISTSVASGSAVSLTNNTAANAMSITLTAGDWDVSGNLQLILNAATTMSHVDAWISSTSATNPFSAQANAYISMAATFGTGFAWAASLGPRRFSVSGSTTVYLGVSATFAVNTCGAFGYLSARRVR